MVTAPEKEREALGRLPSPLLHLYRRAQNAKTPQDRHHYSFFLAEAALKLSACLRLGVVLQGRLVQGSDLTASLADLRQPSFGHWVGFLRDTTTFLQKQTALVPLPLVDANDRLLVSRALPAVKAFAERVSQGAPEEDPPLVPDQVRDLGRQGILGFFNLMASYRNQTIGHGAPRVASYYEEVGQRLLAAVAEILQQDALFGGLTLAVARLNADAAGVALQWYSLRGSAGLLLTAEETGAEPDPSEAFARRSAGKLFFLAHGVRVPLFPLLVYQEDRLERERVGFLNRTVVRHHTSEQGSFDIVRRVEFLDYNTGQHIRSEETAAALTELLARIQGRTLPDYQHDLVADEPERAPAPAQLSAGSVLGDFELEAELGRGAMGIVFRARQRSLDRRVALKVLPPALAADPVALARFRQEVAALVRCDHPNMVKVFYSGSDGEHHFYAMELVDGVSLQELYDVLKSWRHQSRQTLRAGILPAALIAAAAHRTCNAQASTLPNAKDPTGRVPAAADTADSEIPPPPAIATGEALPFALARLFADAADALAHLHDRGVIHRDLKPGNLMITADGKRLVVMDLGLAQFKDRSQSLTRSGWVGTLRYCAPEQLQTTVFDVDERADIYGLGATFYELVTLHPLFDGDSDERLLTQVLKEDPKPPSALAPDLPRDFSAVLLKCLAKDRSRRYPHARDLAGDFEALAAGRPVQARLMSPAEQVVRWARHNPRVAVLATSFLLLLVLLAVGSTVAAFHIDEARADADSQRQQAEEYSRTLATQATQLEQNNHSLLQSRQKVLDSLAVAEKQTRVARQQEAAAKTQERVARQQRDRAVEYFHFARDTVNHFTKVIAKDRYVQSPAMAKLRVELLDRARSFYEAYLEEKDADDSLITQEELVDALEHLAVLTAQVGNKAKAAGLYKLTLDVLEKPHKKDTQNEQLVRRMADLHRQRAVCLLEVGMVDDGNAALKRAQELQRTLGAASHAERYDEATNLSNLGKLLVRQGKFTEARDALTKSLKIRDELVAGDPDNPLFHVARGQSYLGLGGVAGTEKKAVAARSHFLKARECFDKAKELNPDFGKDQEFLSHYAHALCNLGQTCVILGSMSDGENALRAGLDILDQLLKESPRNSEHLLNKMRVFRNLAYSHMFSGKWDESEKIAKEALALQDAMEPAFLAESWELSAEVGTLCFQFGTAMLKKGQSKIAVKWFDQGVEAFERVLKRIPAQPNAVELQGLTLNLRVKGLNALGRHKEALADCDRAAKLRPAIEGYMHIYRASALAGLGDHQAGIKLIDKTVGRLAPSNRDNRYDLAIFFAAAYGAVLKDKKLDEGEQRLLRKEYAGRALTSLKSLVELDYFADGLARDLEENRCFEALRELPTFQDLLAKVKSSVKK